MSEPARHLHAVDAQTGEVLPNGCPDCKALEMELRTKRAQITTGFCQCGCGRRTNIAPKTDKSRGWVRGHPQPYVVGHGRRSRGGPQYRIDSETGCWVWQWSIGRHGYGEVYSRELGRMTVAHRVYYENHRGPIPEGLRIDHLCRNRTCVNPDHLEAVTNGENLRRGVGTKLSHSDVENILASDASHADLARRYAVTPSWICRIRQGAREKV